MRNKGFISVVLCAACFAYGPVAAAAGAREFVHPGIAESAEDIARARRMIAERREPWPPPPRR